MKLPGNDLFDTILRGLNLFFLIVALGLTASLIDDQENSSSRVNMALFACVFGLVTSTLYKLVAILIPALAWPVIGGAFEFLNVIFTFSAATALAASLGVHSCSNNSYLNTQAILEGSSDRCRKAQCATAFLYFSFFTFLISLVNQFLFKRTSGGPKSSSIGKV